MRIALFHELLFGGARRAVEEFAKGLQKDNYVDYYYVDGLEDINIKKNIQNISYFKFNSQKWSGKNWKKKITRDSLDLLRLHFLHKKIGRYINQQNYDFVFIHPSKYTQAPFILRFVNTKKIYYCQESLRIVYDPLFSTTRSIGFPKNLYEKVNRSIRKKIDETNVNHADLILANSQFSSLNIKMTYGKEAKVCYLGVDTRLFSPQKSKKEYDILFVGQKVTVEGYDLLQKSLPFFSSRPIVRFIERDEDGVGVSDDLLVSEMNKSKVVVALSRNEPFGLLPLEAMACGIPIVAISEGGLKESIKNNITGYLVMPKPKEIYFAVQKLLRDEKLRSGLGNEGRRYVCANWTWERSIKRLNEIIKNENTNT